MILIRDSFVARVSFDDDDDMQAWIVQFSDGECLMLGRRLAGYEGPLIAAMAAFSEGAKSVEIVARVRRAR